MKKNLFHSIGFVFLICFNSCTLTNYQATPERPIDKLILKDNSYIGLLNFANFSGSVENKNYYFVNNVGLKAKFYNSNTKQRSIYEFKITVPITANGIASYCEKIFVGKHVRLENVEIVTADRY